MGSLALSTFFLILAAVLVVGVLGVDGGERSVFPVFKTLRAVRISEALERMEPLVIFSWGLGLFVTNAVNLYSGSKGLSMPNSMENYRPLLLPMAVLWVAFGIQQFQSVFEVQQFFTPHIAAPMVYFIVLFPLIVLWTAYFLKKVSGKPPT